MQQKEYHKLDHTKIESNKDSIAKIKTIGDSTGKIRINKMNTEVCQIDDE